MAHVWLDAVSGYLNRNKTVRKGLWISIIRGHYLKRCRGRGRKSFAYPNHLGPNGSPSVPLDRLSLPNGLHVLFGAGQAWAGLHRAQKSPHELGGGEGRSD